MTLTPPSAIDKIKTWGIRTLLIIVITLFASGALYFAITLNYVYAKGERAGYLQKFSKKGWVFKTWEGELAMVNLPGAMPEIFYFTVKDDEVAKKVSSHVGQRVTIFYNQHRGIPGSWYGDTQHFAQDVQALP